MKTFIFQANNKIKENKGKGCAFYQLLQANTAAKWAEVLEVSSLFPTVF